MTWASLLWWKRERPLQHSQLPHTAINGVSCFSFIIICRLRFVRKLHTRSDCHTLTWLWISAKPTSPSTWRIRITARGFLLLSAECSCTYKNFINTSLFIFFLFWVCKCILYVTQYNDSRYAPFLQSSMVSIHNASCTGQKKYRSIHTARLYVYCCCCPICLQQNHTNAISLTTTRSLMTVDAAHKCTLGTVLHHN